MDNNSIIIGRPVKEEPIHQEDQMCPSNSNNEIGQMIQPKIEEEAVEEEGQHLQQFPTKEDDDDAENSEMALANQFLMANFGTTIGDSHVAPAAEEVPKSGRKKGAKRSLERQKWLQNKVPYTYTELIAMAINAQPDNKATLAEIYDFLRATFDCFRGTYSGWKNCIRHTLTLAKSFEKVPRAERSGRVGLGNYWSLSEYFHRRHSAGDIAEKPRRERRRKTGIDPQQKKPRETEEHGTEDNLEEMQQRIESEKIVRDLFVAHWEQQQNASVEELLRRIGIPTSKGPTMANNNNSNDEIQGMMPMEQCQLVQIEQQMPNNTQHHDQQNPPPLIININDDQKQNLGEGMLLLVGTTTNCNNSNGQQQVVEVVQQQEQRHTQSLTNAINKNNDKHRRSKKLDLLLSKMARSAGGALPESAHQQHHHHPSSSHPMRSSASMAHLDHFLAQSSPATSSSVSTPSAVNSQQCTSSAVEQRQNAIMETAEDEVIIVEDDEAEGNDAYGVRMVPKRQNGIVREQQLPVSDKTGLLQPQKQQGPSTASIAQMSAWLGLVAGEMRLRFHCDGQNGAMVLSQRNQGRSIHRLQFIPINDTELLIRQFIGSQLYQEKRWTWRECQEEQTLYAVRGICFHFFFCR